MVEADAALLVERASGVLRSCEPPRPCRSEVRDTSVAGRAIASGRRPGFNRSCRDQIARRDAREAAFNRGGAVVRGGRCSARKVRTLE